MHKRISSALLAILVIFSMSFASAAATMPPDEQSSAVLQLANQDTLVVQTEPNEEFNEVVAPYEDMEEALVTLADSEFTPTTELEEIPVTASARATLLQADLGEMPCNSYKLTLGTDEMHLLQFQVASTKVLFSQFEATNSEYAFALYSIASDGTLVQETNYYFPNSAIKLVLPAGRYAFVIQNAGTTFGNSYTVRINTSTPGDNVTAAGIYKIQPNYSSIIALVTRDGSDYVYCNGSYIANVNSPSNLDWERVLDLKWGNGSWNYNKHEVYNVNIKDISFPGTYTSDYVNSSNAVVIFLNPGTGYMYNESKYSEYSGERVFHFRDPFGNTTPRTLDSYDIATYQCWLIYDLNKESSIDFWSSLNWYYATGTEEAAFTYN